MSASRDVTALLMEWNRGNREALNELLPQVYAELHRMARRHFKMERIDHLHRQAKLAARQSVALSRISERGGF